MQILDVSAKSYAVPTTMPHLDQVFHLPIVMTTITVEDGIFGTGIGMGLEASPAMALFINRTIAPALMHQNALNNEYIWAQLLNKYNNWAMTGFWSQVISAIDIALWDIKGKVCSQPIARLLGGANDRAPTYVTFGATEHTIADLEQTATTLVSEGHRALKMVVGGLKHPSLHNSAMDRRGVAENANIEKDAERVAAVRSVIGPDIGLMVDANCKLELSQAVQLSERIAEYDIAWFEEPIVRNDPLLLRQLREKMSIPIAIGQFTTHSWAHRDLIMNRAIDIVQPNVVTAGGFTECMKIAALARSFNLSVANGGAWPHHNLHLQLAVPNGGPVEFHWLAWEAGERIFVDPPKTAGGYVEMPERPGLGFDPLPDEDLEQFRMDEVA
jgi:L-rhamnonate dehydratase